MKTASSPRFLSSLSRERAVVLGAVLGFAFAFGPSCGSNRPISRCNASTCSGCCDESGSCLGGTSVTNCGAGAVSCVSCEATQVCTKVDATGAGGKCTGPGGTGGGTSTGGGAGGGGGGGVVIGDGGVCNASSCPNGCCSGNTCITVTSPSKCGGGGAACVVCAARNTCNSGVCTACTGCVDFATNACLGGADITACGNSGQFCQTCDQSQGQSCNMGFCVGGTSCNATSCPHGCCDGATCKDQSAYTNLQCGSGSAGAACITCNGECDLDAGACAGSPCTLGIFCAGGFIDGGFNFPAISCMSGADCPGAQCCDTGFLSGIGLCKTDNQRCELTDPIANATGNPKRCEAATKTCK